MRNIATAVLALLLTTACVAQYQPWSLGVMGGYTSEEIEPNLWRITGRTTEHNYSGEALDMALYRAAEIATVNGSSHFEIVNGSNRVLQLGYTAIGATSPMGERSEIFVRFLSSQEAETGCQGVPAGKCEYMDAAATMSDLRTRLRIEREPQR